jgi:[ribosomal protein S5]-alanine N-acetyltransferase
VIPPSTLVRVVPASIPWLEALLEGDEVFAQRFGIPVEPGWSAFPETLTFALEGARGPQPEWGVHLFFDSVDGALVGNGGWKGPPVGGFAELGYAVAASRRNRGIATAAMQELLASGRTAGLRGVVAHTLPTESASTTVLSRCGFEKTGDVTDADDGRMWRWRVVFSEESTRSSVR